MTELKTCPFPPCKGKGQIVKEFIAGEFYFYCLNCGRHTEIKDNEADAIKAWETGE